MSLTAVRDALAETLAAELHTTYWSGRQPSPLYPSTVFTIPQPGALYLDFGEGATFDSPLVTLSAVITGPTANFDVASQWLDAAILLAAHAGDTDPTLGGLCSGIVLRAVGEPGYLNVEGSAPVLSAELRFHSFHLSPP